MYTCSVRELQTELGQDVMSCHNEITWLYIIRWLYVIPGTLECIQLSKYIDGFHGMGTGRHYITMLPVDWSISTSHDPLPSSCHSEKMLWNPSIETSSFVTTQLSTC